MSHSPKKPGIVGTSQPSSAAGSVRRHQQGAGMNEERLGHGMTTDARDRLVPDVDDQGGILIGDRGLRVVAGTGVKVEKGVVAADPVAFAGKQMRVRNGALELIPLPALQKLAASPTNAQIAAAFNKLLQNLIDAGQQEREQA